MTSGALGNIFVSATLVLPVSWIVVLLVFIVAIFCSPSCLFCCRWLLLSDTHPIEAAWWSAAPVSPSSEASRKVFETHQALSEYTLFEPRSPVWFVSEVRGQLCHAIELSRLDQCEGFLKAAIERSALLNNRLPAILDQHGIRRAGLKRRVCEWYEGSWGHELSCVWMVTLATGHTSHLLT